VTDRDLWRAAWASLIFALLAEHDDDMWGERLAVLDFMAIHQRLDP
jgi:hypothetical protein